VVLSEDCVEKSGHGITFIDTEQFAQEHTSTLCPSNVQQHEEPLSSKMGTSVSTSVRTSANAVPNLSIDAGKPSENLHRDHAEHKPAPRWDANSYQEVHASFLFPHGSQLSFLSELDIAAN